MDNTKDVETVGLEDVETKLENVRNYPQKSKEWHLRLLYWSHGLTMAMSIVFTVIAFTTLFLAVGRCDPWYETSVLDEFHSRLSCVYYNNVITTFLYG